MQKICGTYDDSHFEKQEMHNKTILILVVIFLHLQAYAKEQRKSFYVSFPIGSCRLDRHYGDNNASMSELEEYLHNIRKDSCTEIVGVQFIGSASPDGKYRTNTRLSHHRRDVLERFVRENAELPDDVVTFSDKVIVWSLLDTMLTASQHTLTYREAVLHIIRDSLSSDLTKKRALVGLRGGRVWNDMYRHFFPLMRNASAVVFTTCSNAQDENLKITPPNVKKSQKRLLIPPYPIP